MISPKRIIIIFFANLIFLSHAISHEDNDSRIKFWKEYYNPKIEASGSKIPSVRIELIKIGSYFQLKLDVENFKFTPEDDRRNNNFRYGYGKLFMNGKYVSRIYSPYTFIRQFPEGMNEIKVILSTNMDHDISYNNELISDEILYQFPEYNFAEARAKEHAKSTQCEFSTEGLADRAKLQKKGLSLGESSKYLQCRYDSRNSILSGFKNKMTKIQLVHHDAILKSLLLRIELWKKYESNRVSLEQARKLNTEYENNIHLAVEKHVQKFKNKR